MPDTTPAARRLTPPWPEHLPHCACLACFAQWSKRRDDAAALPTWAHYPENLAAACQDRGGHYPHAVTFARDGVTYVGTCPGYPDARRPLPAPALIDDGGDA